MWTTKHGGSTKTVEIDMIDPAYMIGPVPMIGKRVEMDPTVEIEVVEIGIEIKVQERKEEIQALDIPPTYSVTFVR